MEFTLEVAIAVANQAIFDKLGRNLSDVEVIVLKGAWERQDYDRIAAQNQYAPSYISQDVAPKLWRSLTDVLGERVRKSNFREALKRAWQQQQPVAATGFSAPTAGVPRAPDPLRLQPIQPYVERPPLESLCYETLLQDGALVRIKAPSLMGKTSLIDRVLARVAARGYRTVSLSFELAERRTHFSALDKFLRWFCVNLTRELRLPNRIAEYWDEEEMGSKVSCTTYVEDYLLAEAESPLVLCLDDVDLLFPYPDIYEDFFGLLRSWYEKARSRKRWRRLRLAIVHSTDVYIRLNINQSPFNVGLPIELEEFAPEQVREFARLHGLDPHAAPIGEAGVAALMDLVGGHPYLLELAFAHLKGHPGETMEQLIADAPTEAGIYANHLRERLLDLQSSDELAATCREVMTASEPVPVDPMQAYQLQSMGLVHMCGNRVEPRCNLYRTYFRRCLGDAP